MSFTCPICKKTHDQLPHIGSDAPHQWADQLRDDAQSLLTDDLCIIEARDYFVRGVIEIPVHSYEHEFGWGVWVSHKKANFETYRTHFNTAEIGPFFGWLSTEIRYYSISTLGLKTMAHYRGGGMRPRVILVPGDHPLSRQQQEGISLREAWEIVHTYM